MSGLTAEGAAIASVLSLPLPAHEHGAINMNVIPPATDEFHDPVFETLHTMEVRRQHTPNNSFVHK